MRLNLRILPICRSMKPSWIDRQTTLPGRYHLVKDLSHKGPDQISCFLNRVQQVFDCDDAIHLQLISVLAASNSDRSSLSAVPLFDFIGIKVGFAAAYGVILSTYMHDLDRDALLNESSLDCGLGASKLGRHLMDSLFIPTCLNQQEPPFPGQFPVFIFPPSKAAIHTGKPSPTDRYMDSLGFHSQHIEGSQHTPNLRVYRHERDDISFGSSLIDRAVISVGVACVEMANGTASTPDNCLVAFDRTGFDGNAQKQQAIQIQEWLITHLNHLHQA